MTEISFVFIAAELYKIITMTRNSRARRELEHKTSTWQDDAGELTMTAVERHRTLLVKVLQLKLKRDLILTERRCSVKKFTSHGAFNQGRGKKYCYLRPPAFSL